MNIRFTIEEENIIAIYAEDSRETTLENMYSSTILSCTLLDIVYWHILMICRLAKLNSFTNN